MSNITPSQTVGPYFKYGLTPGNDYAWNDAFSNDLVTPDVSGDRIRIVGQVFDGEGKVIPDAMMEIWQADAQGRFADPQDTRAARTLLSRALAAVAQIRVAALNFVLSNPARFPPERQAAGTAHSACGLCARDDPAGDHANLFRG
jgi:hypothetical protein